MSIYVRRAAKVTATRQRGVFSELWKKVAPYVLLDPKHTYSYLLKVRSKTPSGPYGGALTDGTHLKGFRFPAPGNTLEDPVIPEKTSNRNYEITHYTRDTSRSAEPITILKVDPSRPIAIETTDFIPITDGSPGNNNIDVLNYDQSGLRTAMTTTHQALQASLAALQPNHLPESAWAGDAEAIVKEYTEKGLAPVPGKPFEFNTHPQHRNPQW